MGWLDWAGHGITGLQGGVDAYAGILLHAFVAFLEDPSERVFAVFLLVVFVIS